MKKLINKPLLTLIAICSTLFAFAQQNYYYTVDALETNGHTDKRFYATFEDYKNNKPMPGYEITGMDGGFMVGGFIVKTAKGTETIKVKNLPAHFLTYNNWLIRTEDKEALAVLSYGKFCVYQRYIHINGEFESFYSEGITGELKKWKKKVFKEYLEKAGLSEQYENELKTGDPNPEETTKPKTHLMGMHSGMIGKDHVWKEKTLPRKYFQLINEKLK